MTEIETKTRTLVEIETLRNKKKYDQACQVTKIETEIGIEIKRETGIETETGTGVALHCRQVGDINRSVNTEHTPDSTTAKQHIIGHTLHSYRKCRIKMS